MHGVILGINLCDYQSELEVGDLVVLNDGYEDYILLEKIDPRYGKQPDEPDTPLKYFVRSKSSGKLMFYDRTELSKAHICFFDYDSHFNHNKKILLGAISETDLNHIKGKFAMESEIPFSEFGKIKVDSFIGLDFEGETINKTFIVNKRKEKLKIFKINIPK